MLEPQLPPRALGKVEDDSWTFFGSSGAGSLASTLKKSYALGPVFQLLDAFKWEEDGEGGRFWEPANKGEVVLDLKGITQVSVLDGRKRTFPWTHEGVGLAIAEIKKPR